MAADPRDRDDRGRSLCCLCIEGWIERLRILGAIIAGGQARRFGADKAAALLGGRSLLDHVADALRPQVEALIVVGRDWPGLDAVADRPPGALGPLAGLNAALHHARIRRLDGVLSAGCDTLPVPTDLAARLVGARPAYLEGHFLLGWWPTSLASLIEMHLGEDNDRSLRGWIARCSARAIPPPAALYNLNTPADLATYERINAS